MYFLMNDVVFSLELQTLTPPMSARQFSLLTLDSVRRLGREIFANEPRLQHRGPERARRLAALIVSKAPQVNAALFAAPVRNCDPEQVAVRLANLDAALIASLHQEQQAGRLTAALADRQVWTHASAA